MGLKDRRAIWIGGLTIEGARLNGEVSLTERRDLIGRRA